MNLESIFTGIYVCYLAFALVAYVILAPRWLRAENKGHIGLMATSYILFVCLSYYRPDHVPFVMHWSGVFVASLLGTIGLWGYLIGER